MAKMTERMGKEEASFARERLLQMGGREGINFMFDGKVGATRDAHRLMEFAQKKSAEVGDKVVERLFHEFHEEGRNIADRDLLVMAGADAGCDEQEIRSYLESVEGAAEVDKVAQAARDKGIVGVPHFLIHGVHVLDGAQDTGDFLEVFSQVKEAEN